MNHNIEPYLSLTGEALLQAALRDYPGQIGLLSAFNPEDVIIASWIAKIDPSVPIFFLDTKKHFPETLRYVDEIIQLLGLTNVRILAPDPQLVANIDKDGLLWQTQVNRCCWLRKVEPLKRALQDANLQALITGRRMEQHQGRQVLASCELDEEGWVKFNPLKDWTRQERDEYMKANHLPHHPLYELGYLSISCAPCTTPVFAGEDERAGRWRHTRLQDAKDGGKTECGLHVALKNENEE